MVIVIVDGREVECLNQDDAYARIAGARRAGLQAHIKDMSNIVPQDVADASDCGRPIAAEEVERSA